jgi:drug/metabolite transporter (DMT)-like permease
MIMGQLLHVTGGIFEKMLLGVYPLSQMTFIRSAFRLVPLCFVLFRQKEVRSIFTVEQPMCHALRLLAYIAYNLAMLYALSATSLTKSCALQYVTPFFTLVLSRSILKETIDRQKWLAIGTASVGTIIAMRPLAQLDPIFFVILFGSFVGSLNRILIRRLVATEHSLTITLYGNLALALVLLPTLFVNFHPISLYDLGLFFLASCLTAIGQYATVHSLRFAQSSSLAPFDYTSLIWAVLFDFLIWNVTPAVSLIIGVCVIICSNLWLLKSMVGQQKVHIPNATQNLAERRD